MLKVIGYGLLGMARCRKPVFEKPLGFESQDDFDFPETKTETDGGWSLSTRCGQKAVAGSDKDQRKGLDNNFGKCIFDHADPHRSELFS